MKQTQDETEKLRRLIVRTLRWTIAALAVTMACQIIALFLRVR